MLKILCTVVLSFVLLLPGYAQAATATYRLHQEASTTSGLDQLKTAGPDTAAVALQVVLTNKSAAEYLVKAFDTQAGVPNAGGIIASGSTVSFTIWMKKTANVAKMFPRAKLYINSTSGILLCTATGTSALTTTLTKYSLSCTTSAAITMSTTDRFYLWAGVNLTSTSTTSFAAQVQVEGRLNGNCDSSITTPLPTAPVITTLSPISGAAGVSVTITGSNFGASQGGSTVKFNGTTATPSSWTTTKIIVPVPAGATTGPVTVTVGGAISNSVTFTVAPKVTNLNPNVGPIGTSVTIVGFNFGTTQGSSTVKFNGTTTVPTSWSMTSIVAPVPMGATTGPVVITVGGLSSGGVTFMVAPNINTLSPTSDNVGVSVTINGTSFGTTQGTSTVTFNGVAAVPTSWSATSIIVQVPAGASTGPVVVTVGDIVSNGVSFSVIPSAPTNLGGSDVPGDNGGALMLTWVPSISSAIIQQRIYRASTTGGPYILIAAVSDSTVTSYADLGLTNGTTYYYVVRAYNGAIESANSNEANAKPIDNTAPNPDTMLSAVDHPSDEGGAIDLRWTVSISLDVVEQRVYRSVTTGGPYSLVSTITGNMTNGYTDTGLTNGATYFYVVKAYDGTSESSPSNETNSKPVDNIAPNSPAGLNAADVPADQGGIITLSWTVSTSPDVLEQRVYRGSSSGGPYSLITTIMGAMTATYTDSGLTNGMTYYYVVRAYDGMNESANSIQADAAPADNLAPVAPTALTAVDHPLDEGGAIDLNWASSTSMDVTQQRVYRSITTGGPYVLIATTTNSATSYIDTGLTSGTAYYYVVRAYDGTQEGTSSNEVSAKPVDNLLPFAPLNLSAIDTPNDRGGSITLNWTPSTSTDVIEQRLYRGTVTGSYGSVIATIPNNIGSSFIDTGLVDGTLYYYVVRAYDGTNESSNSNEASAKSLNTTSDVRACQPLVTLTTEGVNQLASGTASGLAGNMTRTRPFIFPEPGFDAGSYKAGGYIFNGPIKVGDVNGDGILDVVVLNHTGSPLSASSKVSVILGKGDGSFQNPITVGELNNGFYDDMTAHDFNCDGSPDLALTFATISPDNQNALLVFTGNGNGTFTTGTSYTINAPGKILTGMFDADSYVDIAMADQNGNVSLFHGNGDGSFSTPVVIWSGSAYSRITDAISADFNHDGLTDIGMIVGDGSGGREFLTLLNNGDGTFQSLTILPWDDSFFISNLTFGDLNGDGYADILMLRDGQFNLRPDIIVFMNDGSGNFPVSRVYNPWLVIPSSNYSIFGGRSVRISDLNGDRKLDLLISYLGKVFTLLGNGDGTFQPPRESGISGSWLSLGDFDQDGAQDLVTVAVNHIFTLFGRGDGGFIDREEIQTSEIINNIASTDLDGDRTPDLVLPGDGSVTLFSTILNSGNAWIENNVSPPFQVDHTYRVGIRPVIVKMGDLNKDGHPDLVVANELSNDVSVLLNSGDDDLKSSVSYPVGSAPVFIALEDLNKDGSLDIVTANSGSNDISILLGRADGSFQAQTVYAAGPNPKSLAIADVNGDGHPDIVVVDYDFSVNYISILLGNGDGTFQPYYRWTTSGRFPIAVQAGDFNRDGVADLAVINYLYYSLFGFQSSMVTLLLGKGDGTFDERIVYQSSDVFIFDDILSEDLNRDGKQDLIVFDYAASSAWVFLNDGYGQFNDMIPVGGLEGLLLYGGLSATLGDLDHDGNLDLLVGGGNSLQVWLGQGNGTFISSPSIGGREEVSSLEIVDMNGDDVPDIALVDDNNLSVIPGEGNGVFTGQSIINQKSGVSFISGIAAADLNGDHNQDIVLSLKETTGASAGYPKAVIYWGAGDNTFRQGPTLQTSTLFNWGVFAADVNQDGLVDIVLAQKPAVLVYLNNGDQTFREPIPYTINEMFGGIRLADINHDNHLDIISLDITPNSNPFGAFSNSLSIHTGNGDGTFQYYGTISLDQSTVSDWVVQDLNGDGLGDLAIHVESDNTVRIYLNNGNGTFNGPITYEVGNGPGALMAQDFNKDGFVDLAVRDLESMSLLLGNGDGTFQPPAAYGLGEPGGGGIISRDFNLDGRSDIAAPGSNQVNLLFNLLPPLRTPPSPPKNLAGIAGDGSVSMTWAASPEADLAGYNLYRSLSSGGGYAKINSGSIMSLSYTDTTVANGQRYFYAVAAVDAQGEESSFSRKVKVTPRPADTTPPVVKITTPINGGIAVSPLLFVSGTIDDVGAVVTVNGQSAAVQTQSGTFTAYNIPLNTGVNVINVTAVDAAGNRSSDTATVTYALAAGMTGTVQNALTGEPIGGADVSIQDADGTQTFTTQSNGLYSFTRLIPGQVTIAVTTLNYYQPSTLVKTLLSGQVMTLNIPLDLRPAVLTGTVFDGFRIPNSRNYTPITGATVTVTDHVKTQTVATDSNGKYRIENISPTDITVTVMKAGYETDQQTLSLYPQLTQLYNFYLNQPPPSAPTGLIATPAIRGVALKWNANTESNLLGYNVYRATTSGGDYTLVNPSPVALPSYKDTGLTGGTTYYYVVTAISTSRRESDNSIEASAVAPSPTIPITITFPANGAVINSSSVIVAGTINSTVSEIGVAIEVSGPNGIESVPAHVNRSSFSALIPLQQGSNTITAVAVDPGGAYGEASITVNASVPQQEIRLTANPSSGVPDATTGSLAVTLQVETTLTNPAAQYQWDYEGNGTIDQTGAALTQITVQYHTVGIYYPTVIVTDTLGNTYTATTVVNVLSREELDALLKSKWEGMKAALINGDVEGALDYYLEGSRERYRGIFSALGNHVQEITSNMQPIESIYMSNDLAKYRIRRAEDAGLITYYIYFQLDDEGIWRIKQF